MSIKLLQKLASKYSVLYVEDDENIGKIFVEYLEKLFNKVTHKKNGEEGLTAYQSDKYDLVITDLQMPIMDGLEMSSKIKELNNEQNILITSAYSDVNKFIQSIKLGIDGYILKPIDFDILNETLYKIVQKIDIYMEHKLYKENLEQLVDIKSHENSALELEKVNNYEKTLFALIDIIENRDTYTGKHSLRVAQYSKLIAQELGYDEKECEELYKAGILHDLGKLAIPDSLLLKPTKLTQNEHNLIKQHVNFGFEMLTQIPMFQNIANIIVAHHEREDGSGYPNGLKGNEISEKSMIMAVSDSFDAMTTNRIYKPRKSVNEALLELNSLKEIHFSSKIVDAAKKALQNITIEHNINQNPITLMEQERFAYFYKDRLTELYNEEYLDVMLNRFFLENKKQTINMILLNNFGTYNREFGWKQGNLLLQNIAQELLSIYDAMPIFRIHGDDFIVLSSDKNSFDKNKLELLETFFVDTSIGITLKQFDILEEKIVSLEKLEGLN